MRLQCGFLRHPRFVAFRVLAAIEAVGGNLETVMPQVCSEANVSIDPGWRF